MSQEPLAARMRPRTFDEFVGQGHLVGQGKALSKLVSGGHLPSLILWGPAGSGKTTLAYLLAAAVDADLMQLSAVSSGVADARKIMQGAKDGLFRTVLFVDEVHRWSKSQQDVLLPAVEAGTVTLIGATTENPYFSLVTPLLSRCLLMRLEPLAPEDVRALLERALADPDRGLGKVDATFTEEALDHLVEVAGGDARLALTGLEAAALAAEAAGETEIGRDLAADAVQKKAVVYDRQGDAHYDVISAFIKSIRGSDPDATLFWLARMIEAGEDPRFIARRMIVHASEDVGLADPRALLVAVAAAQAVEHVGLPEARRWRTRCPRTRFRPTFATRAIRPLEGSATGRATSTRTTTRATGWSRNTGRFASPGAATTSRPARERRSTHRHRGRFPSSGPGYDART